RQVQAFVECAIVNRAITKESDSRAICPEQLETVTRTGRLENARADDATGAHQANLRREQVHAAAAPARATRLASVKLSEKLARIQSLGQRMPVSAVGAENDVVHAQMRADPNGDGFLPHVGVASAVDEAALMRLGQTLFAQPDGLHAPIEREPFGWA